MSRQVKRMNERSEAKKNKFQIIDHSVMSKPYVGTYQGLSRQDLDWWQYISELVDNTLTIDRDTQCDIYVNLPKKQIRIIDNSIGIGGNDLEDCISIGKKANVGKQLLSFSGVGMKGAVFSLGKSFEVITKPMSEKDSVYKIVPNFNLDDVSEKIADFTTSVANDGHRDYGTEVIINEITGNYPQKKTTMQQVVTYLGATYADYLESGKLKLTIYFTQTGGQTILPVNPIRPLLSNPHNILDPDLIVGANESEQEAILEGKAGKGWKVKIRAAKKLYPETAKSYYESTDPELYENVYGDIKSPYSWRADTAGINFKSSGIDRNTGDGKILLFNLFPPSSRAEGLWVEVELIDGIEPSMMKSSLNTSTDETKEMLDSVKEWLDKEGFRRRSKVGTATIGENRDVRDVWKDVVRDEPIYREEWGVSLDTFDEQVSTETTLEIGRPDVLILGTKKRIVCECKKEEIIGYDVSQAAGYAVEIGADKILLVAQRMTDTGRKGMAMWKKKLGIPIEFINILKYKTKKV